MRWSARQLLEGLAGLALLVLAVPFLVTNPPAGIIILLLGLAVFPPSRRRLRLDISSRRFAVWCVGLFLLLFGLVTAIQSPLAGAISFGAGLLALPPVRTQLEQRGNVEIPGTVVALVVLVAAAASLGLIATQIEETGPDRANITHAMNESFTVNTNDDSRLRVNVTGAEDIYSPVPAGDETPVTPSDDAFLAVYVTLENAGNESVRIDGRSSGNVILANADHNNTYEPSARAGKVANANRLDGTLLNLHDNVIRLEPGEQVQGAIVYSVDTEQEYQLKVSPKYSDDEGDNHYVPIRIVFAYLSDA